MDSRCGVAPEAAAPAPHLDGAVAANGDEHVDAAVVDAAGGAFGRADGDTRAAADLGATTAERAYRDRLRFTPRCVLVTGGAGFIGSHVAVRLASRYPAYRVVVLDRLDHCGALDNLRAARHLPNFKFVRGDVRQRDLVAYVLAENGVDAILHFAACTHVDSSFASSLHFTENNVLGTHVVLEAARQHGGVRRFVHVSTDEVYGGEADVATPESSLLAPTNPYACSKAAAEFICRGYAKTFGVPIVVTRANNVYGPQQFPDKLVPKSVCLLAAGRACYVHGSGAHARNYLYVDDAACAYDVLLHCADIDRVYNVGSDDEKRNVDVVHDLIALCGLADREDEFCAYVADRTLNDKRYRIDSSALRALDWRPQVSWADGLRRTVAWYSDPANLERWPLYAEGLVPHPTLLPGRY